MIFQIVYRVKGQQHRRRQGHGRVLHRVVQHPHKVSVRQIVQEHDDLPEYGGQGQRKKCFVHGGLLEQLCPRIRVCHGGSLFSLFSGQ